MPNPLTSMPHIYFNKKYIGLRHQNVTVHPPPFAYSGQKGIESCVHQLNNIYTSKKKGLAHLCCLEQTYFSNQTFFFI
jgi:hypothetical protein